MKDMEKSFQEYVKNISIAINYIANVIDGHPHIKDILQKEGIKVFVLGTETVDSNFNKNKKNELKKTILNTIDIMEIGRADNAVSDMNFSVFKEGVFKFISFLDSLAGEETPMSKLMQNLINMQTEIDRKNAKELVSGNLNFYSKNEINNDLKHSKVNAKDMQIEAQNAVKIEPVLEKKATKSDAENLKSIDTDIKVKTDTEIEIETDEEEVVTPAMRRSQIVNLLKDKGGQNIKDIKNVIGQVTDKTILRDITDLMIEKKVFRIGDKRWAKYYLK